MQGKVSKASATRTTTILINARTASYSVDASSAMVVRSVLVVAYVASCQQLLMDGGTNARTILMLQVSPLLFSCNPIASNDPLTRL